MCTKGLTSNLDRGSSVFDQAICQESWAIKQFFKYGLKQNDLGWFYISQEDESLNAIAVFPYVKKTILKVPSHESAGKN